MLFTYKTSRINTYIRQYNAVDLLITDTSYVIQDMNMGPLGVKYDAGSKI